MSTQEHLVICNEQAEKAVLGSCLIDGSMAPLKAGFLSSKDFYLYRHQVLYRAIQVLFQREGDIDLLVLVDYLDGQNLLSEIGGAAFLTELIQNTPSAIWVEKYARLVKRDSDRRRLMSTSAKIAKMAYQEGPEDAAVLYDQAFHLLQSHYPASVIGTEPATWADLDGAIGPIEWVWKDWLAKGFLTILASEPGVGKSILGLHFCSVFLGVRELWPDSQPYEGEPGLILWCEAEAAQSLNLQRAKSWRLPVDRMLFPFKDPIKDIKLDDPVHRRALEQVAGRADVRFVVIDSLSGASRKDENSSETISTVHWLAELARDTGKSILLIHHLRKRGLFDSNDKISLARLRGHSGIVQPARIVMVLDTPDEQDLETKRLSVIKSNLGPFPEPLGLQITEHAVLFCDAPHPSKRTSALEQAKEALRSLLVDGPLFCREVETELEQMGIAKSTARRAKQALGIVSKQHGGAGWLWILPSGKGASG